MRESTSFSPSHLARRSFSFSLSSEISLFSCSNFCVSFSRLIASRSISSWRKRRVISSNSSGWESRSIRNLAAASSIKSIALSGKKRSGVGSSTITVWKRRSKALSFSKYFWYSSNVVAPMLRNSPRAKAGFKMLAASIAPSPLPAPTKVWISSINKIMSPWAWVTSLMTLFKRSSNSPLYLAPATSAPISSE